MRGARTRLFHAIVGLGLGAVSGAACGSSVVQSTSAGTTGAGGSEGTTGPGGAGGATSTSSTSGMGGALDMTSTVATTGVGGSGGGGIVIDAGPDDAQTWDVVPIK